MSRHQPSNAVWNDLAVEHTKVSRRYKPSKKFRYQIATN
jgi:hypothetical protein